MNKHSRGSSILMSAAAIVVLYVVARALLCPQTGRGIFDGTLPGLVFNIVDINRLIVVELLAGTTLLVYLLPYPKIRTSAILLLGFSLVIAIRNAYITAPYSQYVAANIIFGCVVFLASFWLGKESSIYRKAFPILLVGVFAYYGIRAFGDLFFVHHVDSHRLSIFFGHANHLGNVLSFALVYCFSIAVSIKGYKYIILMWLSVMALTLALAHTFSRGAWLGCIVGLVASIFYLRKNADARRICLSVLLLVAITIGAFFSTSPGYIAKRFSSRSPDVEYSVGNRLLLWRYTAGIIRDHWLVGAGIASFGGELRRDKSVKFRNNGAFSSAMNNYLTLPVEAGVPALALYLMCLIYACTIAGKNLKGDGLMAGVNTGLLCGVYSMFVFGLTTYTLSRVYATVLVWSSLGYVMSQDSNQTIVVQPKASDL